MATLAVTIGRGTLAARPSTMPAGSLYYVTDTSTLYRSNGSGWDSVEAAAAAAYSDEQARDAIGAALVAGSGITVTVNDPADTITVAATGSVVGTHTHIGADVTDFAEVTDDRLAALLVAGTGITLTYNDVANTMTIAASGGASATTGAALPWISGRYYDTAQVITPAGAMGSIAFTTGFLLFSPFYVPVATAVDRLGVYVASGVGSATARCGVYAVASSGWPGAREIAPGTVAIDTTGAKESTISATLSAGWHYAALTVSASTPSFAGWNSSFPSQVYGQSSLTNSATQGPMQYVNFTYGALPDPFPALTGLSSLTGVIRIALRAT